MQTNQDVPVQVRAAKILTALINGDDVVISNTVHEVIPDGGDRTCDPTCGICNNLPHGFGKPFLKECFKSWEHYSGDAIYPVPDPDNMGCPEAAYRIYHTVHGSMYSGPYGELRRDLAQHILNKLNELKENAGER